MGVPVSGPRSLASTQPPEQHAEVTENDQRSAAAALAAAERDRCPIAPLTSTWVGMDVEDAYEVQLINVGLRLDAGAQVVGHKVGLTARAMQEMLGVEEPDYGHLLDDMQLPDGATAEAAAYCHPRVEVEVAFVLSQPLTAPECTVEDVLRATDYVVPAIELIDSRIRDWKITLPDTIADNASAAAYVLGEQRTAVGDVDLPGVAAVLQQNGEVVAEGVAGAVLGDPARAVAWLANKLHGLGQQLQPGHVVLPGSCTRAVDVVAGDHIRADLVGLGSVSLSFR